MERGIIFSTPMVAKLLSGEKTQTRRVIKPQPHYMEQYGRATLYWSGCSRTGLDELISYAPRKIGEVLYVRETWRETGISKEPYAYKADEETLNLIGENGELLSARYRWKPSIHMHKAVARIFLKITELKVERLQSISEDDAIAEGISYERALEVGGEYFTPSYHNPDNQYPYLAYKEAFAGLWDSINAKRGYPWESNPWVWVISFERIEKPEVM